MALTQLTKVDGGGISTTSDYRVGVITASKFVGPFDGSAGNFSGIITATGANFSGNVSIGGTLTYEDVTNIDSVGIITARKDIHVGAGVSVVGIVTAATGDFFDLDVDGHTNLDNVSVAGVTTFSDDVTFTTASGNNIVFDKSDNQLEFGNDVKAEFGASGQLEVNFESNSGNSVIKHTANAGYLVLHSDNFDLRPKSNGGHVYLRANYNDGVDLYFANSKKFETTNTGITVTGTVVATGADINGDLDVDGHTNLDNINIAGVTTASGNISVVKSSGVANLSLISGDNYATLEIGGQSGAFIDLKSPASDDYDIRFVHDGYIYAKSNINLSPNAGYVVNINKNLNCAENLDVDGHTNLDNVSVAGISTFSDNIRIADSKKLLLGNLAAGDCQFIHDGNDTFIQNKTGDLKIANNVAGDVGGDIIIQALNGEDSIKAIHDGAVELYHDGTKKAETFSQGLLTPNNLGICFGDGGCKISGTAGSGSSAGIFFMTNSGGKWQIDGNGHFVPSTAGAVNIGSASKEIGDVFLADDKSVQIGNSQDLKIFHDSSANNNVIEGHLNSLNLRNYNTNCTDIVLSARRNIILQTNLNETAIQCLVNGATEIFHDGGATPKLRTTTTGIQALGEVAAAQDYPDFKPSLDLNFAATKKLDPRIKFARQGVASYYDANGNVKFAADNEPRFDHDPDTGECKGLLIEEASVNLIGGSADEGSDTRTPNSTLGNGFSINELVSDIVRPTGTPGLVRRIKSHASGNSGGRWGGYNGSGGSPYAGSFWARSVTGTSQVGLDVNDVGYNVNTLTTKWVRVEAVGTTGNNYDFMDIILPNTSDDIYIWGVQLEQNEYASSYIRNSKNSNAAYRGADTAYIDGESFDEFYNQSEGTMVSSHSLLPNVTATQNCYTYQVAPDTGTTEAPFRLIDRNSAYGNSLGATSINSNSNVCFFRASGNPVTPANKKMKVAFAIKKDDFAASFNGEATSTDTSGALSETSDHLSIGYYKPSPQAYLNGHIQRLTYYPKRLSNTQLQNLSS